MTAAYSDEDVTPSDRHRPSDPDARDELIYRMAERVKGIAADVRDIKGAINELSGRMDAQRDKAVLDLEAKIAASEEEKRANARELRGKRRDFVVLVASTVSAAAVMGGFVELLHHLR
jgi:hypothetical protein